VHQPDRAAPHWQLAEHGLVERQLVVDLDRSRALAEHGRHVETDPHAILGERELLPSPVGGNSVSEITYLPMLASSRPGSITTEPDADRTPLETFACGIRSDWTRLCTGSPSAATSASAPPAAARRASGILPMPNSRYLSAFLMCGIIRLGRDAGLGATQG
jgi:hypothetical protein